MAPDRDVARVAHRQHGAITSAQLHAAGLTEDGIRHRVAKGWLRRRHRGVYLVGPLETPLTAAMAAVLACGERALLSHGAAAVVWGLRPPPIASIDVTVVARDVRGRDGISVHQAAHLDARDATSRSNVPVTSPARTLLDLATQLTQRDVDRAVEEARIHRLVTDHSLKAQFARYPRHPGAAALSQAIPTEPALTRSEAERRLLELVRAARLPEPEANARVNGHEVDLVWRDQRLIVEVDGFAFHSSRAAFERDRRRDGEHIAAGFRVIRVTWRQLVDEPEAVIACLAGALAAQRPSVLARSSAVRA